jgi:hypothetical protein
MRRVGAAIALVLALVGAGCGGDDNGDGAGSAAEAEAAPEAAEAEAEAGSTTTAPAETTTTAPVRPLTGSLEPDTEYSVGDTVGPLTVRFRTGADEFQLEYLPSTFFVYRSVGLIDLSVSDLAVNRVSEESDPALATPEKVSPVPPDLLAWLTARPFFETVEARRPFTAGDATGEMVTLRTKELTTGPHPGICGPAAPTCAVVTAIGGAGPFSTMSGDVTDFAVVEAAGTKVLVVAGRDAVGQQLLQSLRIAPA